MRANVNNLRNSNWRISTSFGVLKSGYSLTPFPCWLVSDIVSKISRMLLFHCNFHHPHWLYQEVTLFSNLQGMDALGVATLDSVANAVATRLPFSPSRPSSLTDEDITNLRNLQRLILLISGLREAENPSMVRDSCKQKQTCVFLQLIQNHHDAQISIMEKVSKNSFCMDYYYLHMFITVNNRARISMVTSHNMLYSRRKMLSDIQTFITIHEQLRYWNLETPEKASV